MAKGKKRTTRKIPDNEAAADRFIRVVTPRVAKAVKAIRTIGFCAAATYEYTPKQVEQIFNALITAMETVKKQYFEKEADKSEFGFHD